MIYAATLRGMVRSLYPVAMDPGELVTKLNTLLVQDRLAPVFTTSYLILNPQENTFQFVSCGYGDLWHLKESSDTPEKLSSDHLALGIDVETEYQPLDGDWNPGDTLYLNTYGVYSIPEEPFGEEKFIETVKENRESSTQEQVNTILQKSRIPPKKQGPDRTLASISLKRI